jgi:hypothetical protein
MATTQDELRTRIDAFTAELTALIKRAALEAVQEALGRDAGTGRRGGARAAARGQAPKGRAKGRAAAAKRTPGQKRDPRELAALVEKLAAHIKANPGQRIEPIGAALGIPTKELTLPIKKLFRAKRIASKGQKRATTYFPAG